MFQILDGRIRELTELEGERLDWLSATVHQLTVFYHQRVIASNQVLPVNNNGVDGDGGA
jgi:hypothetical protein